MTETLGKKIKALRANAGLTQPDLANKAEINQSYLSKIENDNVVPSDDILLRVCKVFDLNPEQLLLDLDPEFIKRHYQHIPSLLEKIDRYKHSLIKAHQIWIVSAIFLMVLGFFSFLAGQTAFFFQEKVYTYVGDIPKEYLENEYGYKGSKFQIDDYFVTQDILDDHIERTVFDGKSEIYNLLTENKVPQFANGALSFLGLICFLFGLLGLFGEKALKSNMLTLRNQSGGKKHFSSLFDKKMLTLFLLIIVSVLLPLMSILGVPFINHRYEYELTNKINLATDVDVFDTYNRTVSKDKIKTTAFLGDRFSKFITENNDNYYVLYVLSEHDRTPRFINKLFLILFPLSLAITLSYLFFLWREQRKLKLKSEHNAE